MTPGDPVRTSTLDVDLALAANHRWWNKWTLVLAVALLLVGGFVAGGITQKAYGQAPAATGQGGGGPRGQGGFTPPTAFPGGGGNPFGNRQNGNGAPEATTGTVKLIDGATVYVEIESGEVITIRTDDDTTVGVPGELKNIKAGDKVTVAGDTDAQGTVSASSVTKTK
jgi:hypothetical protein